MKGQPIDAERIGQQVAGYGFDWRYSRETGSTNVDALEHFGEHQREVVAFSEQQNSGRGRRGRQWHSPFASNIYCTVGMLKSLPANRQGLLSIVTGLALCRVLRQKTETGTSLKWPNDLLLDGCKIGGILIESRPHDAASYFFAIGFGLNVFMSASELAQFDTPATSLQQAVAGPLDRTALVSAAIDGVTRAIRDFDASDTDNLVAEFDRFDAYSGQAVDVIGVDGRIRGVNRGIAANGQLRLQTENGLELHSAAEISLRPGT